MLLRFKFANYRSFRDEVEFSAIGTRLDDGAARRELVSSETGDTVNVLPIVAVLGANASGKSNLISALVFMRNYVLNSAFGHGILDGTRRDTFRLDTAGPHKPSTFEVDFTHHGDRYVYGFELTDEIVTGEWLHTFPHRRTQVLFDREGSEFTFGRNLSGSNKRIADLTRRDALYLSTAAASNHDALTSIFTWFYNSLTPVNLSIQIRTQALATQVEGQENRISEMLRLADLGIVDAMVERRPVDESRLKALREALERDFPKDAPNRQAVISAQLAHANADDLQLRLVHRTATGASPLSFEDESLGTKTWLVMVINAIGALSRGSTLIVDELDASLHPALMSEILRLFSDTRSNELGAQLIFTTHDTWSLDTQDDVALSRGQVWFVEKDTAGASTLTPLSDYRPRKGENVRRGYIQGRYGGVPRPQGDRLVKVASPSQRDA